MPQRATNGERIHLIALSTVLLTILFGIGLAAITGALARANCTSSNSYGGYGSALACQLATRPQVSIAASSGGPFVDEPVTLTATATIRSGRITFRRWDLDDDGAFDDADGLTAVSTFSVPGPHRVSFKAIDRDGDEGSAQVVIVSAARPLPAVVAPPVAPAVRRQPSLQVSFVTRRARRSGRTLGTVEALRVKAISGARLSVVCIRSCGTLQVGRTAPQRQSGRASVTLRLPSRVSIRKSTTIEVRSTAAGYAIRYERYRFRRTSLGVFARQVAAGCLASTRPRRTMRCPPS